MKTSIQVKTFGCKLNHYDSLLIEQELKGLNLQKKLFVLNSCAVTAQAGKKIRKIADKIKISHPDSLIALTGCGAQVESDLYEKTKSIDLIVGNSDKKNLSLILKKISDNQNPPVKNKVFKSNIFKSSGIFSDFVPPDPDRTRAFLKIQDGCDSFCSFCIIPFARGKSKSLPMEFLAQSIQKLEERDVKEAVLTGVHIGDYKDGDKGLEDLLIYLLKKTQIPRLRLTSLEPVEITDKLLELFNDERLCPHFHISLQSASTSVLQSMKRKYSQKEVLMAFKKISQKVPKAFVGLDMIAGFPSESQKDFEESYNVLRDQNWTCIHVFPYSSRKGTYANFKYKNLPDKERYRRAELLRRLSESRLKSQMEKQKNERKKILLFKKNNQEGLSRDYWKVTLPPSNAKGEKTALIKGPDITKPGWLKGAWPPCH